MRHRRLIGSQGRPTVAKSVSISNLKLLAKPKLELLASSASTLQNRCFIHLVGMDEQGMIVVRKRLYRAQVMAFIAQLPPTLIGMEACGGAHYWARRFREHGHEVKLMAPQFVKPYGATCKSLLWLFHYPERIG
jgi:hypothetical protein